ncbi:hypothetical protein ABD87_23030 [Lysinibacillus sphaericus]|uniref:hypothetical protein n=1 Tax=Lysinibacillus sphaericus TaxID=1421 RepID=UPI0018CFB29B|nr:hypothetical protein [Lysinibacillus sphaericus]MBG9732301.1 hypothetical protein [Lysinibacillus sphaericus]
MLLLEKTKQIQSNMNSSIRYYRLYKGFTFALNVLTWCAFLKVSYWFYIIHKEKNYIPLDLWLICIGCLMVLVSVLCKKYSKLGDYYYHNFCIQIETNYKHVEIYPSEKIYQDEKAFLLHEAEDYIKTRKRLKLSIRELYVTQIPLLIKSNTNTKIETRSVQWIENGIIKRYEHVMFVPRLVQKGTRLSCELYTIDCLPITLQDLYNQDERNSIIVGIYDVPFANSKD